ncbi:gamma-glutamyl-gamma-aminobutyrate hydrolase family protein [Deinococcus yavapaiensis]|nr:gamma-glutamyl-gamma-aminobutyrate hydrolase family protein [Deinococcus yavapaiensis]
MTRPRIGMSIAHLSDPILGRSYQGTAIAYAQSLWRAGGLPSLLPLLPEAAHDLVAQLDGLLLTGGVDVAPDRYGQAPHPQLGDVDTLRDEVEAALYLAARARGLPVLGICRGLQLVNVLEGGTLHQHLDGHTQGRPYDALTHDVVFEGDGILARHHPTHLLVNSHHHQAVDTVAPSLKVVARSRDGWVEALEGEGLVCVQWHPELTYENAPETRGAFSAFMELFA